MPVTARTLIEGHGAPICVQLSDPLEKALELMVENDFTQLPIVSAENEPLGLITADSVLRGLAVLGATIDKLKVQDVTVKHEVYSHDDNITDILDSLNNNSAVLITDGSGSLHGIVTNSDAAVYLRRRAQDMMLVEDIELALRDHIEAAFDRANGEGIDEGALQAGIDQVVNAQVFTYAKNAIVQYLNQLPEKQKLDKGFLQTSCESLAARGKRLNDLTFYQFNELLASRWETYGKHFGLEKDALKNMLMKVGGIRNILAHFRDEITPAQRDTLRFCARWFEQNNPVLLQIETAPEIDVAVTSDIVTEVTADSMEVVPVAEEIEPNESRYAKLAYFLDSLPIERSARTFSFDEIEKIIGGELPPSARQHRSWWANDSVSHVQSKQWLDVGWRVSSINMTRGIVYFDRVGERAKMYIDFFSQLLYELREKADFQIGNASPSGASWYVIGSYRDSDGKQIAALIFSFARSNRFRVELYIDGGDEKRNKETYDSLYRNRGEIELGLLPLVEVGTGEFAGATYKRHRGEVRWERLDNRRASRLAIYHAGSIEAALSELEELRKWAVETMVGFQHTLNEVLGAGRFEYRA